MEPFSSRLRGVKTPWLMTIPSILPNVLLAWCATCGTDCRGVSFRRPNERPADTCLQVPEVTCNILDLRGVRRLELLELVLGPGGEDNSVRSLEEVLCNGEPEAAAGACDDENFGSHFGAGENALCFV